MIRKRVIKRVGHESSISVWNDLWILANFPRPANSKSLLFDSALTVDKLINSTTLKWNMQVISTLVELEEAELIESIPLGQS